MKSFVCCLILLVSCLESFSQKTYFIYIQSETDHPFFVQINEKTYSSTASGYLILSKLKDSSYSFKVGFPQNKWPDQRFSMDIKSRDRGFLLKNFGEKGWGLFDLQTMGVQMSVENAVDKAGKTEMREVSAFTNILSKAANDPSLKDKPVFAVNKKEEKTVISQPVVKEEPIALKVQPVVDSVRTSEPLTKKEELPVAVKEEIPQKESPPVIVKEKTIKTEPSPVLVKEQVIPQKEEIKATPEQEHKKSVVVKKSESSTTEGFGITFVDEYADGEKDTIQIIIPNQTSILANMDGQPEDESRFIDVKELPQQDKLTGSKNIANNNCSSVASENDFLKLRKKMVGQKTDDSMINEAEKVFKAKCFTIEQVKNLGNLFLNEAGKFQFYEAAYPHSSDRDNFTVLQAEFKDNYFIHRFKNLVKAGNL
jgi:hypothetical protein